ncbi:glycosyltransferase family 4 protein [Hoeflea sp. TYP-13]|uniref:glycosyltransferase family 4 protein n=1 Tax=Hoeflea sp. TYP-13 TaxID=3230023 RepID=UPI0034C64B83
MADILPLSSILPARSRKPDSPLKICIVTSEFLGPVKNGGIGAAISGLLEVLRKDGHELTVLYTLVQNGVPVCAERDWPHWVSEMQSNGIRLVHIDNREGYRSWRLKSWLVMEHLGSHAYDLVFFNEHHGSGYYSICAKHSGLEPFANQTHCVLTHGSIEWIFDINEQYMSRASDLELMGMERRSVEWADHVIGPSKYILEKYDSFGWALPASTHFQPLPLFHNPVKSGSKRLRHIDELVFFGRLEIRKGLWVFCDALDRLSDQLENKTVTFLGRTTTESGMSSGSLLMARSAGWPFKIRMISNYGQEKALEYLRGSGRLAVMPSIADNSPCVIYECMENGIPFISTTGSGIQELVDKSDHSKVLVPPNAVDLAEKLKDVLANGAEMAGPAFDTRKNLAHWSAFTRLICGQHRKSDQAIKVQNPEPGQPGVFLMDSGGSLRLLVRNLISNHTRISEGAPLHLITHRGSLIRNLIANIVGSSPDKISVLDTEDTDAIRKAWRRRPYAVVCDSEVEISQRFFDQHGGALTDAAIVSCVVAERDNIDSEAEIATLPCGNLPGLPFLGYAIGSGLWACDTKKTAPMLSEISIIDIETDDPISAKELGQFLMLKCIGKGQPVQLMPIVGGIGTYPEAERSAVKRKFTRAARRARLADIAPNVRRGGPAWLALSAFSTDQERSLSHENIDLSTLGSSHPLNLISDGKIEYSNTSYAAALGKSRLAFELAASEWMDEEKSREVLDLITSNVRETVPMDLLPGLDDAWQGGDAENAVGRLSHRSEPVSHRLRELLADKGLASQEQNGVSTGTRLMPDNIDTYFLGRSVDAGRNGYRLVPAKDGSIRVMFLEVSIGGRTSLEIEFGSDVPRGANLTVAVIDQKYGSSIASGSTGTGRRNRRLSVPLHGIHLSVLVLLEGKFPANETLIIRRLELV